MRKRLFAIDILRLLKSTYTYEQLYNMLNLSPTVLSRYVNGHVLPSDEKADAIINMFSESMLKELLKSKISKKDGAYDLTSVCYDPNLQQIIAKFVANEFELLKIDKVLTAAVDGIPTAIQIGNELRAKSVVIAKGYKEVGVDEFIEERACFSPVLFKTFYVPKGSIRKNEKVLIVDDIMRTGATIEALIRIVERSKAIVAGVFTIFSIGDCIEKLVKKLQLKCKVISLVNLS